VKRFILSFVVLLILFVGCAEISSPEIANANWHEQGLTDSSDFTLTALSLPLSGSHQITGYIKDGYLRFQGDILLSEVSLDKQAAFVSSLWSDNTIAYAIDPELPKKIRKNIAKAVKYYNTSTNLKWIPRSDEEDYVEFSPSSGCASYVGRRGGRQPILLAWYCSYSAVLHEMGHALGFQHEQTRPDRDESVTVHWDKIPTLWQSQYTIIEDSSTHRRYDYYSIMHYPAYFGRDLVIEPKLSHIKAKHMGYREEFSKRDILAINYLYPLPPASE
jgi:Astacin (Peptidase family M12A)